MNQNEFFYKGLGLDFRNKNLYALLKSFVQKGSVLDVGCGDGQLIRLLKENYNVIGLDNSYKRVRNAEKLNPDRTILHLNALNIDKIHQNFDNIILCDILEHVRLDNALLSLAVNNLNPGGRLIIATSQYPLLYSKKDVLVGHYRRYRKQDLTHNLGLVGLSVTTVRNWDCIGVLPYAIAKLLGWTLNPKFRRTKNFLNTTLDKWFSTVERYVDFGVGLSLIIVATKE